MASAFVFELRLLVVGQIAVRFREDGAISVDFPVPMMASRALIDPAAWSLTPLTGEVVRVVRVGRELRRVGPAGVVPVAEPTRVELFLEPPAMGSYLLQVPILRSADGDVVGPASIRLVATRVKGPSMRRSLGRLNADQGTPLGLVIDAIAAEDTRIGGGG